jgi:hypothetical protein
VYQAQPQFLNIPYGQVLHVPPFDEDIPLVFDIFPNNGLHERRFSGAVLSAEGMNLSASDLKIQGLQRLDAGKGF